MFDMIPFRRNNSINKRGDDIFDSFLNNFFGDDMFYPSNISTFGNGFKVDLKEDENNYMIEADLPGIKKENIDINLNNNYLTISAKRQDDVEDKNGNYVRRERRYGEFKRSFYIDNVDENTIDASFSDGVLKVILPKKEKTKESQRRIDIH
ncbi:heat-shock protein [Clostridium carboxidivorans P7]|uniref:Heat shock protein Hsp20 n=1 Tax=Clostridium carboxidivorans P7 TaxID=536227 RepID=C6Q0G5_9CLOT|nr:heat shock protein Hsp18 [Clostridium carboxidivorans]AKN33111.1 heat-shock protein [Clostridium carboxidivorans P7]EET85034.1 heat shock protein Hsp20 [Clostridium carboxidivorans P7]EFG87961.1 Hsp20/alpha crystallin family protein [Clostridium carboxidivorans P7]